MNFRFVALSVVTAAIFLPGCGGGDSTTAQPLTKKEFIRQANAICVKGVKEKDQILEAGLKELADKGHEPAKKDLETVVLEILPPLEQVIHDLGELSPPAADQKAINKLLAKYEAVLQKAESEPSSALGASFLVAPNEASRTYGLTSCIL